MYLPVIYPQKLCFEWDVSLMWIYVGLQSAIDMFYAMDIFIFSWRIRGERNAKMTVNAQMLQWLPIIHRIYLFLPISQAVVLLGYFETNQVLYKVLRVSFYPIQYTLRVYCTFGLNKQRPNVESGIGRWLPNILDCLPFIIASHLFGALWYGFAVDREIHCWREASFLMPCHISDFHCHHSDVTTGVLRTCNMTHIKASCDPKDKKNFEFGIFRYALQSNFTRSAFFPRKFLQSFWWGLRNLSSFGSNLETSSNMLEICFSILTSISGLVLFLIYLNARVEVGVD
ncbi:hypothetical protein RchiOBHm_Chr7g0213571 [Rosa chinensis]|uniref:Ion transport domain-containing protein n=1 Tax=Rosa chinensis TaxID=74649 RepID=A0A2P6PB13_ROSCH|nr:hypothetical protein RchiOBHm_Chr7g0213571 [Rosa chinensis]